MQFKRGEYGKGECETNTDCGSLVIEWLAIFLGQLWFNAYSSILYLFSQILAKFCECLRISIILCIAAEAEKLGFLGQMQMDTFVAIGISSSIWNLFNTIFFLPSTNELILQYWDHLFLWKSNIWLTDSIFLYGKIWRVLRIGFEEVCTQSSSFFFHNKN